MHEAPYGLCDKLDMGWSDPAVLWGRNSIVAKRNYQSASESTAASSIHWRLNSCPIHEVRHPRFFSTRDRNCSDPCCSADCRKQYPTGHESDSTKYSIEQRTYSVGASARQCSSCFEHFHSIMTVQWPSLDGRQSSSILDISDKTRQRGGQNKLLQRVGLGSFRSPSSFATAHRIELGIC